MFVRSLLKSDFCSSLGIYLNAIGLFAAAMFLKLIRTVFGEYGSLLTIFSTGKVGENLSEISEISKALKNNSRLYRCADPINKEEEEKAKGNED